MINRVLTMLHEQPAYPWTLGELARRAAISRAALAARFTHLVGHAPMRYLALWRMQMAARLLADRSMKVAAVGHEVGYESEAAFSRAFKKLVGMSPAGWRDTAAGIANKELDARGRG
jgi:AraC-like DNA-binding protein